MPTPDFVAVLDTSVLMRLRLLEFTLRIAGAGGFHARWSTSIEEELRRTLAKRRPEIADRVLTIVSTYPHVHVHPTDADRATAEPACHDPDDIHVLAAALAAQRSIELPVNRPLALVTDNTRDFNQRLTADLGIDVTNPDRFLTTCSTPDPNPSSGSSTGNHPNGSNGSSTSCEPTT